MTDFANTGIRMNAGTGQPNTRSLMAKEIIDLRENV